MLSLLLTYLPVEHAPHDHVEGSLGNEVVHVYGGGLADAVGAVLRLLHMTWIPVELSKDHMGGGCQSQALRTNVYTQTRKHQHHRADPLIQKVYHECQAFRFNAIFSSDCLCGSGSCDYCLQAR